MGRFWDCILRYNSVIRINRRIKGTLQRKENIMSNIDPFDLASAIADYELIDAIVNRPRNKNNGKNNIPVDNMRANVTFQEDNTPEYYKVIITVTIPRE